MPNQAEPLVRADHQGGAHGEPVWALRWLDKGPEFEELLVSASSDGRVAQWSMGQVGEVMLSSMHDLELWCRCLWKNTPARRPGEGLLSMRMRDLRRCCDLPCCTTPAALAGSMWWAGVFAAPLHDACMYGVLSAQL